MLGGQMIQHLQLKKLIIFLNSIGEDLRVICFPVGSVEPQTAIGLVEAMDGEMKQQMTGRLIEGLTDYDVNFATDYVMDMAESGDPNIAQHMKR